MRIPLIPTARALSGRANSRFVDLLVAQVDAAIEGARLVRRGIAGEVGRADAVEAMREIEHRGDDARGTLVEELRRALVTPIDREDLFRLSGAVDDLLDNLRDFLTARSLFEMERARILEPVIDAICDAFADLRVAFATLNGHRPEVMLQALGAKKSGNAIRRAYDVQLAALLQGEVTAEMLRTRELLRRLDVVGLRFATAADVLSDARIRRAQD
jgi:hypothetical protein